MISLEYFGCIDCIFGTFDKLYVHLVEEESRFLGVFVTVGEAAGIDLDFLGDFA